MRAVLDTNVVASAVLWAGTPERLIEAAGAAHADAIVTGDADLHALGSYKGISILTPAQCAERIARFVR